MGKLVLAFLFFLAASTLAIREARPLRAPEPPPPHDSPPAHESPSHALHEQPPWVRLAPPISAAAPVAPAIVVRPPAAPVVILDEPEALVADNDSGDIPDREDRCPDQPEDNRDDDGCPEPFNGPVERRVVVDVYF